MNREFEKNKKEILTPFLVESGAALMDCQGFEYGISLLLHLFSKLGVSGLDIQQTTLIMENETKRTAGQLIKMLNNNFEVSVELEEKLHIALEARNNIIHRIIIDNIEKLVEPETRESLISEIKSLRSKVRSADKIIRGFVNKLSIITDGFDAEKFKDEIKVDFR